MKYIKVALVLLIASLLGVILVPEQKPEPKVIVEAVEIIEETEKTEKKEKVDWRTNQNNCDTNTQWIWSDGSCHNKVARPQEKPSTVASGDCADEIRKYDWNVAVALEISRAESGLNAGSVYNNPATKDYSVGCFQINLYGSLANNRPSEAWLKVAKNNVKFAYGLWQGQGWKPWSVCSNGRVDCY